MRILNFRYSHQTSHGVTLNQGVRQYVELLLREANGGDVVGISFKNPENEIWSPMTSMYLERSHF